MAVRKRNIFPAALTLASQSIKRPTNKTDTTIVRPVLLYVVDANSTPAFRDVLGLLAPNISQSKPNQSSLA